MLIISNNIFDSVEDKPFKGYLRTENNIISEIGRGSVPSEVLADAKAKNEEIIQCGDKTLMPSFMDNHVHVFLAALDLATCNLSQSKNEEDAAKMLYEFYKNRDDKWIISFAWSHYDWDRQDLPVKETLDKYFPDRPVIAINDELHALWANSKAFDTCGITKATPDPLYAKYARDEKGNPAGYVLEQDAMEIFMDNAIDFTDEEEEAMVTKFIKKAHSVGVTAVGDMEILGIMKNDLFGKMEKEDKLPFRIFFSPSIKNEKDYFLELKEKYRSDRLALLGAKAFIDGTPLGYTGMLVDEYSDRPGFFGEPVLDLKWFREKVKELNQLGIPVRIHACGDGAVREALNAIEECQLKEKEELLPEYVPGKIRNTIEHIENIHEEDLERLWKTGTIASIQPYHMSMDSIEDHPIFEILGEKRSKLAWPGRGLAETGAVVALGTDCPIVPLNPFKTLYCAVNRVMEDGSPQGGFNPEEKFSLADALKGTTERVAKIFNREDRLGTLEKGKLADLLILTENIFGVPPLEIERVEVERTIFNGKTVYERGEDQ